MNAPRLYTVRQVARLAQVSVRTLHHYDAIGLLPPTRVGENGYRYYDDDALLRLQQILLYREIGLPLAQIRDILSDPAFDLPAALRAQRTVLHDSRERLAELIDTIDRTLEVLAGEADMNEKDLFQGFTPEQQAEYEREARLTYGPELVNESSRRWKSYTAEEQQRIMGEWGAINRALAAQMEQHAPASDPAVQAVIRRWHEQIRRFYEPTHEIMRGLADGYVEDERFRQNYEAVADGLAEYMRAAVLEYVDALETAEIEQMLADDDANRRLSGG